MAERSSSLTPDPRIRSLPGAEVRRRFVDFFAQRGHEVVPSASLIPAGDQTLLFTNSGMVQFKDVLTGVEKRGYKRAVDYQRVLRVAGKHNDFEEVGRTTRHNTMFEMLGNWSFGDYFKREAIQFAWEFLTRDLGLPGERLAATTYTTDEVAWDIWHDEIGLPSERMARWGDVDAGDDSNFWRMAETGPCGPCSEIHFDRGAHLSEGPHCVPDHAENCPRWLEIWNLVFMEFDQRPEGRVPLPFTSVDTGMSLERLTSVVQQVPSNYDTDLFAPIHERMRELLGHDPAAFEVERFSYQVIADHSRAVTFLIGDGVMPSNEGRGYVLRRILRRAVRHGRLLGRREPFLAETAGVVIETMSDAYPHLADARDRILEVARREEEQFARTLEAGTRHLEAALADLVRSGAAIELERRVGRRVEDLPPEAPVLDGGVAFRLHDTYGFPYDLTVELAAEYGVSVDQPGFEEALNEQRARSRAGTKGDLSKLAQQQQIYQAALGRGETQFLGYETTTVPATVRAILRDGLEMEELASVGPPDAETEVILDRSPFYAEGGGQIGDRGVIAGLTQAEAAAASKWTAAFDGEGNAALRIGEREPDTQFRVLDTQRPVPGLIVHRGRLRGHLRVGQPVLAVVDAGRRSRTMRNHTATHLLHRALRNTVGESARQAGSLVAPESLRFDYPFDRALTAGERRQIEDEVRGIVRENRPVSPSTMTMAEAVESGADAFFDEKYGETVRTVRVEGYSHELCGGTHCSQTGQIGSFLITGERSIGSGMRRIEAVTGDGADALVNERLEQLERVTHAAGAQSPAGAIERVTELQARIRQLEARLKAGAAGGPDRPGELARTAESVDGTQFLAYAAPFDSMEELKAYARDVRGVLGEGVIALALEADEPQLFVTVSPELVGRGISAGVLVQAGAPVIEGRGGGRPEMAQARGTRRDRIPSALEAIRLALSAQLDS